MEVCLFADRFGRTKPSGVGIYIERVLQHITRVAPEARFTGLAFRESGAPRVQPCANLTYEQLPGQRGLTQLMWALRSGSGVERRLGRVSITHALLPVPVATRGPWVVTVHDLTPVMFPAHYSRRARVQFELSMRAILRRHAHVVAISHKTASDIRQVYGIPDSRMTVIHCGIDAEKVVLDERARASLRERYGLPERFISFLGTITHRKNLVNLVHAFAKVARALPDVHLVLIGSDGFGADEVRAAIASEGFGSRVHLPGYVGRADAMGLIAMSELFAFPSVYEGFGMPPLEAMVQGTPVVAARGGSIPEIVGDAALLSDPDDVDGLADNMIAVVSDRELQNELRSKGFARSSEFSWTKMAQETFQTYTKLV